MFFLLSYFLWYSCDTFSVVLCVRCDCNWFCAKGKALREHLYLFIYLHINDIVNSQYLKWYNKYCSQLHFPPLIFFLRSIWNWRCLPKSAIFYTRYFLGYWRGYSSSAQRGGTISMLMALIKTFFFHQTLIYFAKFYLDTHPSFKNSHGAPEPVHIAYKAQFSFDQSLHREGPDFSDFNGKLCSVDRLPTHVFWASSRRYPSSQWQV